MKKQVSLWKYASGSQGACYYVGKVALEAKRLKLLWPTMNNCLSLRLVRRTVTAVRYKGHWYVLEKKARLYARADWAD